MLDLIGREPVVTAVLTVVGALVALLVAFGVDLTATQQAAIGGFCAAVVALAGVVRHRVTPTRSLRNPYSRVPGYKRELERRAALAKQAKPKE